MNTTPDRYLPPEVQKMLDMLEQHTGTPATCDTSRRGRFHIEHGNDRIRLTVTYTRKSNGRLAYASELFQDGNKRDKVKDVAAYARLLADPDLDHPNRRPTKGLPKPHPIPADELLPVAVEAFATMLPKLLADNDADGVTWEVGFQPTADKLSKTRPAKGKKTHMEERYVPHGSEADTDRYVVAMSKPDGATVHMYFEPTHPGSDLYFFGSMAAVDSQQRDMMLEHEGDLDAVFEKLFGFRLPETAKPKQSVPSQRGHTTASAGTANSVTVRKSTVFRI